MEDKSTNLSVSSSILAVLWHLKQASLSQILKHHYVRTALSKRSPITLRSSLTKLVDSGYIERLDRGVVALTQKGYIKSLRSFVDAQITHYRPEMISWDGGWRIIYLTPSTKNRRHQVYIQRLIKKLGFKELHKRFWVYPYPVPRFLKDLIISDPIRNHVRLIVAGGINNDSDLRNLFNI